MFVRLGNNFRVLLFQPRVFSTGKRAWYFAWCRNEDSFCSRCWSGVLESTRGWRRAVLYLPLSCVLAWRPNKLWLSYVAGKNRGLPSRNLRSINPGESWSLSLVSQPVCWQCYPCCTLHRARWDDEVHANQTPIRSLKASWIPGKRIMIASRKSWWAFLNVVDDLVFFSRDQRISFSLCVKERYLRTKYVMSFSMYNPASNFLILVLVTSCTRVHHLSFCISLHLSLSVCCLFRQVTEVLDEGVSGSGRCLADSDGEIWHERRPSWASESDEDSEPEQRTCQIATLS